MDKLLSALMNGLPVLTLLVMVAVWWVLYSNEITKEEEREIAAALNDSLEQAMKPSDSDWFILVAVALLAGFGFFLKYVT